MFLASQVCLGDNLTLNPAGQLEMAPWSVPRNLIDVVVASGADTQSLLATTSLPGRLLVDRQVSWVNTSPVAHYLRVEVTRRWKRWMASNPNVIQFRDRWTSAITAAGQPFITPEMPVVTGTYNSITGGGVDAGTNTVAEPNPGVTYYWWGTTSAEEWLGPVHPGETFSLWYRGYVWTPPPWSDNANKNSPRHAAEAGWSRIAVMGFPEQSELVKDTL